jgi:uncharacterized ferritin-like protein (DUF455 family)
VTDGEIATAASAGGPPSYADLLLEVIAAPTASEKARLLEHLAPPCDGAGWPMPPLPSRPGRPESWREAEAPPRRRRTLAHAPTRNRFLLAIHHIELSAVDLAVVACLRAAGAPMALHRDFLAIAADEARHAGLLEDLLSARGLAPGDEPVHHRLWEATLACSDLGEHLVVVPRFLEARGLDVSAELLPRLADLDPGAHGVLEIIYRDEIGHVGIGTRWHRWWCAARGLEPEAHFRAVVAKRFPGQVPGPTPLDRSGRGRAGFSAQDLGWLEVGDGPPPG